MSIIGVTQTFLQSNRETRDRVLRAYVEGVAMMVYDKERAVKILAQTCADPILPSDGENLHRARSAL